MRRMAVLAASALLITGYAPIAARARAAFAQDECDVSGFAWNYSTKAGADQRALEECKALGGVGCHIVNDDLNLICFAYAVDYSSPCGPSGEAYYDTPQESEYWAVEECQEQGGTDCRVQYTHCDNGGGGSLPPIRPTPTPQPSPSPFPHPCRGGLAICRGGTNSPY